MDLSEIRGGDMDGRARSRPGGLGKIIFCFLLKKKGKKVVKEEEEGEEKRKRERVGGV